MSKCPFSLHKTDPTLLYLNYLPKNLKRIQSNIQTPAENAKRSEDLPVLKA
jgi:hypothetical protein